MVTTDHELAATQPSATSIAGSPVAFAWKAIGILRDGRAVGGQAGSEAAGAAARLPAGAERVAGVVTRLLRWIAGAAADELRIRRDRRQQLMGMDEHLLRDVGLTPRLHRQWRALRPGLMRRGASAEDPAPARSAHGLSRGQRLFLRQLATASCISK